MFYQHYIATSNQNKRLPTAKPAAVCVLGAKLQRAHCAVPENYHTHPLEGHCRF